MEDNNKFTPEQENISAEEAAQVSVEEAVDAVIPETEEEAKAPKKSWKQELREWVISIAAALMVVFILRYFLFQIIRVDGDSMNTTLLDGERLFVTVPDVKLAGVDRGDVVICHYPNRGSVNFVKRAVAIPGDFVYRKNGVTHVVYEVTDENGNVSTVDEALDERYGLYFLGGSSDDYEPYQLREDEYFVVGDNRYNSHDSRDWNDTQSKNDVGPITGDMIVGKVQTVIWPLDAIRNVK